MGNNLLIVFQENFLFCNTISGGFRENFFPGARTIRSCQFVQVDTKVNTILLVLRECGHGEKEDRKKWGSVLVVSITWCESRSVTWIIWCESRSRSKVL